jgi:hypothetical protein
VLLKQQKTNPDCGKPYSDRFGLVLGLYRRWLGNRVRQPHNLFAIERKVVCGNDRRVGNDLVDIARSHAAGIAKIINLDRRSAPGKNIESIALRECHQVDDYIDLVISNQARNIVVARVLNFNKIVEH